MNSKSSMAVAWGLVAAVLSACGPSAETYVDEVFERSCVRFDECPGAALAFDDADECALRLQADANELSECLNTFCSDFDGQEAQEALDDIEDWTCTDLMLDFTGALRRPFSDCDEAALTFCAFTN